MHRSLLEVLCCPRCRGRLAVVEGTGREELAEGTLGCSACGQQFEVEEGIPVLGDREFMAQVCDRWLDGMLTQELYRSNIENSRGWYSESEGFAELVDAAAATQGVVVDVATGPRGSLAGALVPRFSERTHFVMSDAAVHMLKGLKNAWSRERHRARVDFLACDGNRMPFCDEALDAITSRDGFACANDDPTRSRPPTVGPAYREGHRALKPGGRVFDVCTVYAPGSKTEEYLQSLGCENASRQRLEAFLGSIGFEVTAARELHRGRGKSDPGDGLPIDENDEWAVVAYVLRKVGAGLASGRR